MGRAIELSGSGVIQLPDTRALLQDADELTFAFWVREPNDPTDAKAFLRCRSFSHGFEIYRGIDDTSATHCMGEGRRGTRGDCAPFAFCHDRMWHHIVLRWFGGHQLEAFLDGRTASTAETDAERFRVFSYPSDLEIGQRAGAGPMLGTLQFDELKIWDRALSDAELTATACATVGVR